MFISSYDFVDFTSSTLGDLRLGRRLERYGLLCDILLYKRSLTYDEILIN